MKYQNGLWEIVSNRTRTFVGFSSFVYIYIPFSQKETKLVATEMINPCWRLKLIKKKT